MPDDVCPKCGAPFERQMTYGPRYECGTFPWNARKIFSRTNRCYETSEKRLQQVIRDVVKMLRAGETYECPNGGRAYCLSTSTVDALLPTLEQLERGEAMNYSNPQYRYAPLVVKGQVAGQSAIEFPWGLFVPLPPLEPVAEGEAGDKGQDEESSVNNLHREI